MATTSTSLRMLRLPAVRELTGLGRDTIYRLARAGEFPKPRKITERCSAWRLDELEAWMDSRPVSTEVGAAS